MRGLFLAAIERLRSFRAHWLRAPLRLGSWPARSKRKRIYEPDLQLLRLEPRRLLNADFSLIAGSLQLDLTGDDDAETITVGRVGDDYSLQLGSGTWNGASPDATVDMDTLTVPVDKADRLTLLGSSDLDVILEAGDFTGLTGGASLLNIGTLLSNGGTFEISTLSITSTTETPFQLQPLDVMGDVDLTTAASVVDTVGGNVSIAGDFAITTGVLPGDFDNDGAVNASDYSFWRSNFGLGATAADANGDGETNAADYTVWRDNLGRTRDAGTTGIDLGRGSNLSVDGQLTTVSLAGGEINVGVNNAGEDSGRQIELGSFAFQTSGDVRAFEDSADGLDVARHDFDGIAGPDANLGSDVSLTADRGTLRVAEITARDLNLAAVGQITELIPGGTTGSLQVARDLTVTTRTFAGDFNGDFTVDTVDYALWKATFNQSVAPGTLGDANRDGIVDAADYTIWRDQLGSTFNVASAGIGLGNGFDLSVAGETVLTAAAGPIEIGSMATSRTVALNNVRFQADGNVTIVEDSADGFRLRRTASQPGGVAGDVSLTTTAGDLVLDSLTATSLTVNSAANITDVTGADLRATEGNFTAAGDVMLADESADRLTLNDSAQFTAPNVEVGVGGVARFDSLSLDVGMATLDIFDPVMLSNITADQLTLSAAVRISQQAATSINISGDARFESPDIFLANMTGQTLSVAGEASFIGMNGGLSFISIGQGGVATFGSLAVVGVDVDVAEADDTLLASVDARIFNLSSAGAIADTPTSQIAVESGSSITAVGDIVLADTAGSSFTSATGRRRPLIIESSSGDVTLGELGDVVVNGLSVIGDEVDLQIDGDLFLRNSQARRLTIDANGFIDAAVTDVAEDASFNSLGDVSLSGVSILGLATITTPADVNVSSTSEGIGSVAIDADEAFIEETGGLLLDEIDVTSLTISTTGELEQVPGTIISVAQLADLTAGGNISIGTTGTADFGTLSASGQAVVIEEASATTLDTIDADSLVITSDGDLTDSSNIVIAGDATFIAAGSIVLADNDGDLLTVGGHASFDAVGNIAIGPLGLVNFGTLSLSGVNATVQEDSNSDLDQVAVDNLTLESSVSIDGILSSQVTITDDATFIAASNVALATQVGSSVAVGGDALFEASGVVLLGSAGSADFGTLSIEASLADVRESSSTELATIDLGSFTLESAGSITDSAAASLEVSGSGSFTGTSIQLSDNASDLLDVAAASFEATTLVEIGPAGTANFGTLAIDAATALVQENSSTTLTFVEVGTLQLTSAGDLNATATSLIDVTADAEFTATNITFATQAGQALGVVGEATFSASGIVLIGPAGAANFGTLSLFADVATVQEDSDTELNQVDVGELKVDSAGAITDTATASIESSGDATFTAATQILLGEGAANLLNIGQLATFDATGDIDIGPAGTANFGSLSLFGDVATVFEDSSTVLQDVVVGTLNLTSGGDIGDNSNLVINGDAMFVSAGPIILADNPGDVLTVTGEASFDAGGDIELGLGGSANFGSLRLMGDSATVRVGSGIELDDTALDAFSLEAAGNITDAAGAQIVIGGQLDLTSSAASITLSDNATDLLSASGLAIFEAVGNVTIGPAGTSNFGSLRLIADVATVQEDSNTRTDGIDVRELSLTSAGSVTDALGTTIDVAEKARIESTDPAGGIFLADFGTDVVSVGGLATFITALPGGVFVGSPGTVNFGALSVRGGTVEVFEDSDTVLVEIDAGSLSLTSAGTVTDDGSQAMPDVMTSIVVAGNAEFAAAGDITLANADGDTFTVGGAARFTTPTDLNVGLPQSPNPADPNSLTQFGSIRLDARDVVFYEDNATIINGLAALDVQLTSGEGITDSTGAVIDVSANATFSANGGSITLADLASDTLRVIGDASFMATSNITLGQGSAAEFGRLSLDGQAAVVNEGAGGVAGTELVNVDVVSLVLESAGPVTDAAGATIDVAGNSRVIAEGKIELAEAGAEILSVGGTALWQSTGGETIDLGIAFPGGARPATEASPSAAAVTLGSVGFITAGDVRIAQDNDMNVVLGDYDGNAITPLLGSIGNTVVLIADDGDSAANGAGVDINLSGTVTADALRLQADGAIQQTAAGVITAGQLQLVAGYDFGSFNPNTGPTKVGTFSRDVTLLAENQIGQLAAAVANGSLRLVNEPEIVIANTTVDGRNLVGLRQFDARTAADAADRSQDLVLELQSLSGGIRQQRVDTTQATAVQVPVDVDVVRATFTVADGASVSLVDMEIDVETGDTLLLDESAEPDRVRDDTANRFYVDNASVDAGLRETQLVFESPTATDPVAKPQDLFIADQTAIRLGFADADRTFQLDIAGQLAVIAGRSPDSVNAITQQGAARVGGDAQFHAAGTAALGNLGGDINLPDLKILGPIGVTTDGGNAMLANEGDFVFRGDIDTFLPAGDLSVTSMLGSVTDELGDQSSNSSVIGEAAVSILVTTGDASFNAAVDIELANDIDDGLDSIFVGGLASFNAGRDIEVGVLQVPHPNLNPTADLVPNVAGLANFGSLSLDGINAKVQEDSGTLLDTVRVNNLNLFSAGSVTDVAGATILVQKDAGAGGNAKVTAVDDIALSDNASDILTVEMLADFKTDNDISVGPAGTTNFRMLSLQGRTTLADIVTVQEDSSTDLLVVSARMLDLTSNASVPPNPAASFAGNITDAAGASINVEGSATFKAEGFIELADMAGDAINVDDLATFSAGHFVAGPNSAKANITIGQGGTALFGTLSLFGNVANVFENGSTDLVDVSVDTLMLTAVENVRDVAGADIVVDGDTTIIAQVRDIALANSDGDNFQVSGLLDLDAQRDITVGIDREGNAASNTQFGSIKLAGRNVELFEDDATLINSIGASNLELGSADRISDQAGTQIVVLADAFLEATGSIELANDAADLLRVDGLAHFAANASILLGLGGPAQVGRLSLTGVVTGGTASRGDLANVREMDGTLLSEVRLVDLILESGGLIEDVGGAGIDVSGLATFSFIVSPADIILGDAASVVDFNRLRVVDAQSVSLREDNGFVLDEVTAVNTFIASASVGSIVQQVASTFAVPAIALRTPAGGILLHETITDTFAADAGGSVATTDAVFDDVVDLLATERIEYNFKTDQEVPSDGLAPTKLNLLPPGATRPPDENYVALEPIALDDQFGVMLLGDQGDITIAQIDDPTTGNIASVDGVQSAGGQVYIAAKANAAAASAGDLVFDGSGIAGNVAVNVTNDSVFTAVADGELIIVPGTRLEADGSMGSGSVTDVDDYFSYDDRDSVVVPKEGVQLLVTPPGDQLDSATTRFVGAGNDFTQTIELVVGSPGETNLQLLVDYSDGQLDTLALDAQLLSVENVFSEDFLFDPMAREEFDQLPTRIVLLNDPRINLFAQGGDQNLNRSISDFGTTPERIDNFVLARVQNPPSPVAPPEPPEIRILFEPPEVISAPPQPISVFVKQTYEELGSLQTQDQLIVVYGRVDESGEDIAPETEETWEQGGSDYAAKIKQKVRESDRPAGQYMIKAQSTGKTEPDKETFNKRSTVPTPFDTGSVDTINVDSTDATFEEELESNDSAASASNSHQAWNQVWRDWSALGEASDREVGLGEAAHLGTDAINDYAASNGKVSAASALMVGGIVLARRAAETTQQGWIERLVRRRPR